MKPLIAIVDDDPIIRLDIREMLEEAGYQVAGEAKNGQDAIELAARTRPDLVIMDIKMPVMNGIKAARIIRSMREETAVLLLTAYSQRELVTDARSAGVSAYLVKPVSEADLIPAVEMALSQNEKMAALHRDIAMLKQSLEERKLIDRAKGLMMKANHLDEEEAYRKLRSASMHMGVPLAKLAALVVEKGPHAWNEASG
ncbi:ANTAR domain-containing response regulator [Paenibacillus aestuarii]|uniref:ANTAR domain-containing response regulator n=1 Tax=Paenibacillus aestuarii TaxID=516965 RepID=A0ABW0K4Y3_9BACL|nr:response regulator [Paenibacillus aestuarii]